MTSAALRPLHEPQAEAIRREPETPVPVARPREPVDFAALIRFAEAVVPTGFLPDHIKTPGQCVAIVLTGRELGMEPMRAIRSLKLVKGKVIEDADSQLARFKADGGHATFTTLTRERAVLWLRHPNGDEHTQTFTIEDARQAGLAGKDIWKQYPEAMLRSRAITAGLKSLGWEGGVGDYGVEEAASFAAPEEPPARPSEKIRAPSASDAQRAILDALSEQIAVFTAEQCDGLAHAAEDATLTASHAADLIRQAQLKVAKHEIAHPPAAALPEGKTADETEDEAEGT